MNKKNYAIVLVVACLTLIAGLVFLFDAVDVAFNGAISHWYLVLMLYLTGISITIAIIRNAPIYYTIASIFIGVFMSMSFDKSFGKFWALIPICISIGMMVTHFVSHGRFKYFKVAIVLLILSIVLLIGGITGCWKYIVPIELIAASLITIIYVIVKMSKHSTSSVIETEDYHVRPTKEDNNKKEEL